MGYSMNGSTTIASTRDTPARKASTRQISIGFSSERRKKAPEAGAKATQQWMGLCLPESNRPQSGSALVIPMRHNEQSTTAFMPSHPGVWYCNGCEICFACQRSGHCVPSLRLRCRGDARLLAAFTFKPNVLLRFSGLSQFQASDALNRAPTVNSVMLTPPFPHYAAVGTRPKCLRRWDFISST